MKRFIVVFFVLLVAFSATAFAGVMETVKAIATAPSLIIGLVTVVLLYVLKAIPNDKIQALVGKFAYGLGVAMTLGLSKFKFTAPFWQTIIEPYFVDLVDNTIGTFTKKFIEGVRSDNNG
jgi:hypothetical protein